MILNVFTFPQSTAELLKRSQLMGISPLEVVQRIYEGKIPDILPSVKNKLAAFVKPIIELRQYAASVSLPRHFYQMTSFIPIFRAAPSLN
jgi:hypothetical protein